MNNKYIILPTSIAVALDGDTFAIENTHDNFALIKEKLENEDFNIRELIDPSGTIKEYSNNEITVENGVVYYKNLPLQNNITGRILEMFKAGDDFNALLNFLQRAAQNPNPEILKQIDKFLEGVHIPIGNDGCLYAYKAITPNYKDLYTGKIDNSVGAVVTVDRDNVDDDRDRGCSHGLHCGNIEYVRKYGGYAYSKDTTNRLVIVRLDPADIVSVPRDHSYMKVRCCEYKVVCEVTWDYLLNMTVQKDLIGEGVISVAVDEYDMYEVDQGSPEYNDGYGCGCGNGEPCRCDKDHAVVADAVEETLEVLEDSSEAPEMGSKWTETETNTLIRLKQDGATYGAIADVIGRSANACRKRFNRYNK